MADKARELSDIQRFWSSQIGTAKKQAIKWHKAGTETVKQYRDDHTRHGSQFNILWANTEILKPAVLSRISRPNITRRFKDENRVARDVAETLEKVCSFIHDESEFATEMKQVRDDFLLPGRGVMRFKYKSNVTKRPMQRIAGLVDQFDDDGFMVGQEETEVFMLDDQQREPDGFFDPNDRDSAFIEDIATEEIIPEYVYWKDFLTSNSRTWSETWWVAFRHGMDVNELEAMFGKERITEIDLPRKTDMDSAGGKREVFEVWEIWDKRNQGRAWFVDGATDTIEIEDAPLDLKNFFPCPKPLVPFSTNDTMQPIPLFMVYRDQARELNEIIERIRNLTTMLKVSGVYDSAQQDKVLDMRDMRDGEYKAVQGAGDFAASGGFANAIFSLPIVDIVNVIESLNRRAAALKAEIFELTGIADIMRGHTDPSEGVGTQRIKTVFGTLRLRPLREPMEDFIRESYEIISEIAADKFQPTTFEAYTGERPSDDVMELMQSDNLRQFRINVETDSTVIPNEEIDRANAAEFLGAISAFLGSILPVVQAVPELAPMAGEMLKFGARSFKAGRALEDVITESIDRLVQQGAQPQQQQPEPPDPRVQVAQIQAQTQAGKAQIDAQSRVQAAETAQQTKLIELQAQQQIEAARNATIREKNKDDILAAEATRGPV